MLVTQGTMIMVIDGAKMLLFRNDGKDDAADLKLVEQTAHDAAATAELGTDRPGRSFSSNGEGRSAYQTTDLHQAEEDSFSRDATQKLNALAKESHLEFIVVAAPHVLGVMRKHYSADLRKRLIAEIDKDYTARPVADIAALLMEHAPC